MATSSCSAKPQPVKQGSSCSTTSVAFANSQSLTATEILAVLAHQGFNTLAFDFQKEKQKQTQRCILQGMPPKGRASSQGQSVVKFDVLGLISFLLDLLFILNFVYVCACVWICTSECKCPQRMPKVLEL